jgi:hypothetical protein
MNGFLFLFFILSSLVDSIKKPTPKFCVDCKHFINDNNGNIQFGKCALFFREDTSFLVTGESIEDYRHCSTSRMSESMCGREGKMFKRKYLKKIKTT